MKPNIGRVNALIRITVGLTILACSTAQLTRKRKSCLSFLSAIGAAMKVAEGITRFCPVVYLLQNKSEHMTSDLHEK